MEQIKPFAQPDRDYTRLHNSLFDVVMPTLKPNAWKLLCFILRKTNGWNKPTEHLSYGQLRVGTGIASDATLSATIKELVEARYIIVTPTQWQTNEYALNYSYIIAEGEQKQEADKSALPATENEATSKTVATTEIEDATEIVEVSTTEIEEPPTTVFEDTKRNEFKEKEKERVSAQGKAPQPATPSPLPLSAHPQPATGGFEKLLNAARENANGNYGKGQARTHVDGLKKKLDKFGIDQAQFTAMVDSHLSIKGTKDLADGDGEAADRALRKAQQFVVDLCGIGQRFWTADGVNLVWDSWKKNDWRSDPSEQQLLEHASQMVAGKVGKGGKGGATSSANGNGKPAGVYVGVAENLK